MKINFRTNIGQNETNLKRELLNFTHLKLQIEVAVDKGEDEIAVTLLEQEEELNASLATDRNDLAQAASDAEKAKESLNSLRGEIDKLKREKDKMVAKIKDAEARKHIQEQLDLLLFLVLSLSPSLKSPPQVDFGDRTHKTYSSVQLVM